MSSSTEERASPLRSYDAAREWTTVSEVARQALIARLRQRGLLVEAG